MGAGKISRKKNRKGGHGTAKRKGKRGTAVVYLTRNACLKKLQINLRDFRKLCILKGIYPRDPRKKVKGKDKTYFYLKDINYLAHDPLLKSLREYRTFKKKVRRFKGRDEESRIQLLHRHKPSLPLEEILRDRYPTFADALHDMDDALSMVNLFTNIAQNVKIQAERVDRCVRLCREFEKYVIYSRSLRKVFCSIKGYYYQAEICGQPITWLVPHHFPHKVPTDVDLNVMMTFLHVWESLVKFVNFKLFSTLGLHYPPVIEQRLLNRGANLNAVKIQKVAGSAASTAQPNSKPEGEKPAVELDDAKLKQLAQKLEEIEANEANEASASDESDEEEIVDESSEHSEHSESKSESEEFKVQYEDSQKLFEGFRFFLAREVPHASLEFVIKAHGGQVSWAAPGMPYKENDEDITHHIVDRDSQRHTYLSREYVQPQWVFDSVNHKFLLPCDEYSPTAKLPPHLSPFVNNDDEGYVPDRQKQIDSYIARAKGIALPEAEEKTEQAPEQAPQTQEQIEDVYKRELEAERLGVSFSQYVEQDQPAQPTQPAQPAKEQAKGKGKHAAPSEPANNKRRKTGSESESENDQSSDDVSLDSQHEDDESSEDEVAPGLTRKQHMQVMMLPKKKRNLFKRIQHSDARRAEKIEKLKSKAARAKK